MTDGGDYGCDKCDDTGYYCENCLHADGDCICEDGPDLVLCDECCLDED
jgi:hypothetical protein